MKRSAARLLAGETSPQAADATSRTQSSTRLSTRSDRTARLALRNLSLSATDAKVALGLAQSVARVPNLVVNGARTQRARQEAQRDVAPVYRNIAPGTTLIAAGTVIDSEKWAQLQDLDLVAPRFDWITALSRLVLCALVVGFGAAFVARFSPLFAASVSSLWLLAIFPVLALALCRAALRVPFGESMVLPIVACAAMTLTILLDVRAGALCALGVSILLSALVQRSGGDGIVFTSVALGSMIAVLAIGEITSRMHLVKAGAVIALTHAALYAVTNGLRDSSLDFVTGALSSAALAAGATVVAAGLAMFLERPFGITTHLSLLELSSPDEPIMRRMQGEAPGTYTHSLMVAQLAEAGAKAVGADSLLCRVGGLYHDIGKLRRPHCFVENQHGVNVHDRLSPQLSALLIVSHVKDGLTLARALRPPLPRPVQDIIAQHHGRSLVSYFYHRALKDAHEMASIQTSSTQSSTRSPNALAVDESLFRYPGPRPQSKEAAIVMLADSVEASSRSLPDLTPEKLAEHIRHMIESRLREGELDDCALTLRDLSTVERAFAHVLRGALHQRIEYPDPTRDFNASARGERRDDDWAKNAARDRSEKRNDEKRNNGKHPENRRNAPRRSPQTATNSLTGDARNEYSMKGAKDEREFVDTSAPAQASAQAQENKARVLPHAPSTRAPSKRDVRKATADALSSHVKRKENSDSPGDNQNGNHQNGAA